MSHHHPQGGDVGRQQAKLILRSVRGNPPVSTKKPDSEDLLFTPVSISLANERWGLPIADILAGRTVQETRRTKMLRINLPFPLIRATQEIASSNARTTYMQIRMFLGLMLFVDSIRLQEAEKGRPVDVRIDKQPIALDFSFSPYWRSDITVQATLPTQQYEYLENFARNHWKMTPGEYAANAVAFGIEAVNRAMKDGKPPNALPISVGERHYLVIC